MALKFCRTVERLEICTYLHHKCIVEIHICSFKTVRSVKRDLLPFMYCNSERKLSFGTTAKIAVLTQQRELSFFRNQSRMDYDIASDLFQKAPEQYRLALHR